MRRREPQARITLLRALAARALAEMAARDRARGQEEVAALRRRAADWNAARRDRAATDGEPSVRNEVHKGDRHEY